MKKILKRVGIGLLIILTLLMASPFLFQSQIKDLVRTLINDNVNANVAFEDVDLSFLKSFPQAHITVDNLTITTFAPFENDTLASIKSIEFNMSINELFKTKGNDPIVVNSIEANEASIFIKTDINGKSNYNIAKVKTNTAADNEDHSPSSFNFNIDYYNISNSSIIYSDDVSKTTLHLSNLNHSGVAKFSNSQSELDTYTATNVSLSIDNTNYLNNIIIKLDALLELNLAENIYTFKKNRGFINQLPLEFNGFVKLLDKGQDIDITFKNPESSFKDFLALVPEQYSKNLDQVETSGDFKVNGIVKGMITDTTIPTLAISIISNNARFKYPELPKSVENIIIDTNIINTTGNIDDTFIAINTLKFKIDEDEFSSSAILKNLTKNILVDANIDGTLNLANISKTYPITLKNELRGVLKGTLHTAFDMNAIENNTYERIKNNGAVSLSDFIFSSEDIVNPIHISKADITFSPKIVTLQSFDATTGTSDFRATGAIQNLLGFLLSDNKLRGTFNVNSTNFAVSDFMVEGGTVQENSKNAEPTAALKIPAFLECIINVDAKTVLYDNLTLKDVAGTLLIKDEKAQLQDVKSSVFDGNIAVNGTVDTKLETPKFNMDLDFSGINISQSFKDLEILQSLAPIANAFQGKLNSTVTLSGDLTNDFTPNLGSISGNAIAELLTAKIASKNSALFEQLDNSLSFFDLNKLNFNDLKTKLSFKDGTVQVAPFNLKYEDIKISINGSHDFDKNINYKATFDVPAKYLGSEITGLMSQINDPATKNISIPVTATIGGSFTKPSVSTDLSSGISNLTTQLINIKKQQLLNQGKDNLKNLLGDLIGGNTKPSDSTITKKDPITSGVNSILGGLLGKKKKKKDSIKN